jgi:hypothetical protein
MKGRQIISVIGAAGCAGHLWNCGVRGWLALDANEKPVGLFETTAAAATAVLDHATGQACQSCSD